MVCSWAPPPRRIPSGLRAHQGVYVRIKGLTHIFSGLRATNTPRQTPNPPKRRPIQQKQAIFSDFRPMGLHFGGHIPSSRGLAPPIGGNCTTRGSDTPATRRKKASCSAKPPTDADVGVPRHRKVWWRGRGSVGPGTVPGTVAGRQTRQNSPGTAPPPLNPRQNSPSNLKNVKFGVFRARRANFFAHNPTTADAWSAGESKRPGRGARGRRQGTAIARQPARGLRQSTTLFAQQQPRQATSGTKLSPHTHPRRMCGTKLSQHEPHGPTSGTKLSPLARNGLIWRSFYMQGEFYTVVTTKKPSRENFVPNARQRSSKPTQHTRHHRSGKRRRGRRARPRCRHPVGRANTGSQGQRQTNFACNSIRPKFNKPRKRCNSNDANSMFEQAAGELHAKLLCRRARPRCRWAAAGPG